MTNHATNTPLDSAMQPLLVSGARQLGVALSNGQVRQFEAYHHLLVEWNERFNLTAITGYDDVQTKHFLDSLAGLPLLQRALGESDPSDLSLCDVGTGAGFPGIPLKIALPGLALTLIDGTAKKIAFLETVCSELGLGEVALVQGRAEELGQQVEWRAQFDIVTARAVAPLNTLVEYLLPLVKRDGHAMIYKGANAAQEVEEARKAIGVLGGAIAEVATVQVPHLQEARSIILLRKVKATPVDYPRGQGLARKQPL